MALHRPLPARQGAAAPRAEVPGHQKGAAPGPGLQPPRPAGPEVCLPAPRRPGVQRCRCGCRREAGPGPQLLGRKREAAGRLSPGHELPAPTAACPGHGGHCPEAWGDLDPQATTFPPGPEAAPAAPPSRPTAQLPLAVSEPSHWEVRGRLARRAAVTMSREHGALSVARGRPWPKVPPVSVPGLPPSQSLGSQGGASSWPCASPGPG